MQNTPHGPYTQRMTLRPSEGTCLVEHIAIKRSLFQGDALSPL